MCYPSKEEFIKLTEKGNVVPVYQEMSADFDTPLSAFLKIDGGNFSFLLESVEGGEHMARYSFLGSSPEIVFESKGKEMTVKRHSKVVTTRLVSALILLRYELTNMGTKAR